MFTTKNHILNNGRVNIEGRNELGPMMMADNPHFSHDTQSSEFKDAVKGNMEQSPLNRMFFSKENIRILQNGIKAGVYKRSHDRFVVSDQDEDTLKIIMRSIYFQYGRNLPDTIVEQVSKLNNRVLEYAIHTVYNEAVAYMKYKHDVSTLAVPHARPVNTAVHGTKTLELKTFM